MTRRLRALLDGPLEPGAARAMAGIAAVITIAFASLVILGWRQTDSGQRPSARGARPSAPPRQAPKPVRSTPVPAPPRQDPQDRTGTPAARRAARQLRTHRALQHLPYHRGELSIEMSGARRGKAVLSVSAPSLASAHEGWHHFLHRYADSGAAYLPRFLAPVPKGRGRSGAVRRADHQADRGGDHPATRLGAKEPGVPHGKRRSGDTLSQRSLRDSKVGT